MTETEMLLLFGVFFLSGMVIMAIIIISNMGPPRF